MSLYSDPTKVKVDIDKLKKQSTKFISYTDYSEILILLNSASKWIEEFGGVGKNNYITNAHYDIWRAINLIKNI